MLTFSGGHMYAKFMCHVCGYEWCAVPIFVWRGNGCQQCGYKRMAASCRTPFETVKKYIEDHQCELLSDSYKNDREKLEVNFECGHVGSISFECFKRGIRCTVCGKKKMALSQRLPDEKILSMLEEGGLSFICYPEGYVNRNSYVTFSCNKGHVETRRLSMIIRKASCSLCVQERRTLEQMGSGGNNWRGGIESLTSHLKKTIKPWKKESIIDSNYVCILCKERFNDVHHLYNFYTMMMECLSELGLESKSSVKDYSEEELSAIESLLIQKHNEHPLGVCLCRKHHKEFHRIYGLNNNIPEQFYEYGNSYLEVNQNLNQTNI
jgi:hypothetical protein